MSRTQKTKDTTSPVKLYIEWSSDEKCWKFYDKEKKENSLLPINTPFTFLDQLTTVAGYDDKAEKSFYGSEVRDLKKPIKVFRGKEKVAEGAWADIKDTLRGMKFAKSVYAMAKINDEFQLVQFKLSGCGLSWFDFVDDSGGINALEGDIVIAVVDTKYGKKGKVEFEAPVFKVVKRELTDEAAKQADELDAALQAYLEVYLDEGQPDEPSSDTDREAEMADSEPPAADYGADGGGEPPAADFSNESDNLGSDIPF